MKLESHAAKQHRVDGVVTHDVVYGYASIAQAVTVDCMSSASIASLMILAHRRPDRVGTPPLELRKKSDCM